MSEAKKLVWIQLAQTGVFKGHPQGPFELTPQVFSSICRNFEHDKLPIPIDAEHASEMPPTSGNIPVEGAPAFGWIHSLDNRGQNGLWGQVEWLEPARSYIKEGRYKFLSPAIRFKSKDRVTGEQTGPRLSSAAITNSPFLPALAPLKASVRDGEAIHMMSLAVAASAADTDEPTTMSLDAMCYSSHEFMPRIKSALGMHELSNAMACSDRLCELRDHLDSVNGDHNARPEGVELAKYLLPLRTMVNAPMGSTWDDVLDTVQDMIDSAIAEHVEEYHEGADDAVTSSAAATVAPTTLSVGSASAATPAAPAEPSTPAASPVAPANEQTTEAAEPTSTEAINMANQAPATPAPTTAQPAASAPVVPETKTERDTLVLTMKLQDAESEVSRLTEEVTTLKAWKTEREEKDLVAEVSVAFETHREKKRLKLEDKPAMLRLLKADPEAFRTIYPPTPLAFRHLLNTIATSERNGPAAAPVPRVQADIAAPVEGDGRPVTMSIRELSRQIQAKTKCSLGAAQQEAERQIRAQRKTG